jgi:hypothetical protein
MPKGQVTEEELATGLRGMGGLSALAPTKRDSPFRDSRADVKSIELPAVPPAKPSVGDAAERAPSEKPSKEKPVAAAPKERSSAERQPRAEKRKIAQRKADIYSEPVTLRISPEMRDEVDSLARDLQRAKTSKEERITSNSVIRVAIRYFLDEFPVADREQVNTELELLAFAKRKGNGKP